MVMVWVMQLVTESEHPLATVLEILSEKVLETRMVKKSVMRRATLSEMLWATLWATV